MIKNGKNVPNVSVNDMKRKNNVLHVLFSYVYFQKTVNFTEINENKPVLYSYHGCSIQCILVQLL